MISSELCLNSSVSDIILEIGIDFVADAYNGSFNDNTNCNDLFSW